MDLRRLLLETFRSPDYQPPTLPTVAMEVFALAQKPDIDFRKLTAVLENDPVLAARVLKMAQTPYYSRGVPLRSIYDAVSRLGLTIVRNIVWDAAINTGVYNAKGYTQPMEQIRQHSRVTAHCARLVCEQTSLQHDHAFLAGLLHDLGLAVILISLSQHPSFQRPPQVEELWTDIHAVHEEAGSLVARLWQLPEEIVQLLGQHHDAPTTDLAAAVLVAEQVANELGETAIGPASATPGAADVTAPEHVTAALEMLDLDVMHVAVLRQEAEELMATVMM